MEMRSTKWFWGIFCSSIFFSKVDAFCPPPLILKCGRSRIINSSTSISMKLPEADAPISILSSDQLLRNIRENSMSSFGISPKEWWSKGVYFNCTECGKCCQVEGEVWLSPNEVSDIAIFKGITTEDFFDNFGLDRRDGWIKLKNKESQSNHEKSREYNINKNKEEIKKFAVGEDEGEPCIFLSADNKCSIYEVRPLQCSTYPYWPRIMKSPEAWMNEKVEIENEERMNKTEGVESPGNGKKYWNVQSGGCEGILGIPQMEMFLMEDESDDENLVDPKYIALQLNMLASYYRRFPSTLKLR